MRLLGLLVASITLTACGNEAPAGSGGGGGSPVGKSYLSVKVTEDRKDKQLAPGTRLRLDFGDKGGLGFNAGCNQMGGEATFDGGTLVMDAYGGTEMSCGTVEDAQEKWFGDFLTSRPTWKRDGDVLTLAGGSTTIVLKLRQLVEPDLPLDGTTWTVEGMVSDRDRVEHFATVPPAYITVDDGRVIGSTGCNQFQGTVAHTATTVPFGALTVTDKACTGDALRLQDGVLARLKGQLTYSIDHDRLRLRRPDGVVGLDLVAGK
ncbi:META domain-containing protein [Kribbella turkmenica]|uniref:META domain-containing protein n=2 Tax=Kribbella turkmenica TaxID=2530375 RepID=A0A4R4WZY7_9ACTN|nr:META domain-containing protein [Kribbella turkmenica]